MKTTRRLFLGCPIPSNTARDLHQWSTDHLGHLGVRVIPANNLHVTLMFFGDVEPQTVSQLRDLISEIDWDPLAVHTIALGHFGRNAFGVELAGDPSKLEHLEDRLGRTTKQLTWEENRRRNEKGFLQKLFRENNPLVKMSRFLPEPENEAKRRRQRQNYLLSLHVTLARLAKDFSAELSQLQGPNIEFELRQVALFESILGPSGSTFQIWPKVRTPGGSRSPIA